MLVDTSDRREQRKFGLVMAVCFAIIGLIRWWLSGHPPYWAFIVGGAFLVFAAAAPFVLRPVFFLWMKFAMAMHWVMIRLLLTVVFWGLFVPMRLIFTMAGKDALRRKWQPDAATYWEEPDEQPAEVERYLNQF